MTFSVSYRDGGQRVRMSFAEMMVMKRIEDYEQDLG